MKKYIKILFWGLILFRYSLYPDPELPDWKFDDEYKATRIFLHNFATYDFHPLWELDYEKNLLKKNELLLSFGSTHVKDLSNEIKMNINQELGKGWWFRSNFFRHQTQYKDKQEEYFYMGFERRIYKHLSIFSMCNAEYDKEFIDLDLGFSIKNKTSEKYFRLALSYDDFLYDEKNQIGGRVTREPLGITWQIRYGNDKFNFFTTGKVLNPFQIKFENQELSPDIYLTEDQTNNSTAKIYYFFQEELFSEFKWKYYLFTEKKLFYESENDYSYKNVINDFSLQLSCLIDNNIAIRPVLHYVFQEATAKGIRNYDFKRKEIMPAVFCEYNLKNTIWEAGLLGTVYKADMDDIIFENDYFYRNDDLKFYLCWIYNFSKNTKLKFSLSHVFAVHGFGGGNLQYMMRF